MKQNSESFEQRIAKVKDLLTAAECVIIGGGAGLSAAAGLTYDSARFRENFADFAARYGVRDMYSATFYPFASPEEKWAYMSRHILVNRFAPAAMPLYKQLRALVRDKEHFVVTTNVDAQFYKSGFAAERVFAVQGDYGRMQCARACHDKLYDDEAPVRAMAAAQSGCRVPTALVPGCPVCGGAMEINIRKDEYFVQDAAWHAAARRYEAFAAAAAVRRTVLLELGVGYNTPAIIRFPFERMTLSGGDVTLVRVNRDYPEAAPANAARTVSFDDIGAFLAALTA